MNSDWRDGFPFIGNHVILDFLNTCPVMDGQAVEMLPDGPALARWLAATGLVNERDCARLMRRWDAPEFAKQIEELRRFRESVRETVLKMEHGDDISPGVLKSLNRLLTAYPYVDQVVQTDSGRERRPHFAPDMPEQTLAPLSDAFADLLTVTPISRIRKCPGCILHFYDTSKKGTRVWCSMNLCGNRAKVAAFADRRRTAAEKHGRDKHARGQSKKA